MDDFIVDLSILLDNRRFEQFEEYDIPSVILPQFILKGTSKAFSRLLKNRTEPKSTADALKTLENLIRKIPEKSISRFEVENYSALFESLVYCMEDLQLEAARSIAFAIFKQLIYLFDFTGRYLLLRQMFKQVANGSIKVQYEPQILAFFIDLYRKFLAFDGPEAIIFREELTYFYTDISKVNYREVELCFQYFIAIGLLVQFQATIGFNKELLKSAKLKVLEPIFTQVSDFRSLENLKEGTEQKFEHLDFLLFSLDDSMHIINKSLRN